MSEIVVDRDPVTAADVALPLPGPARRSRTSFRWTVIAIGMIVIVLGLVLAMREHAGTVSAPTPLAGKPAPLRVSTTIDGQTFSPDSLKGRWTVVNFFSSWCGPCVEEQPELVAFQKSHAAAGDASIVGIVFHDTDQAVSSFFAREGGSWPVVKDVNDRMAVDFGVTGVPESFLVDPSGKVVTRIVGGVHAVTLEPVLQKAMQAHAAGSTR